ncbi:MAG: putative phosphate transport regulator [Firmicutes bacterium]|nr:putative phosphate transport regulator [Bacillota bacterium]
MFRLKPREDKFFKLFSESTRILRQGAQVLHESMKGEDDLEQKMKIISDIEHQADETNDEIVDLLNRTFITPLDREDINLLATMIDDVVDFLQGIIERIVLYKAGAPSPGATELARLLEDCTEEVVKCFDLLPNIRGNRDKILDHIRKISVLESEGDRIYRQEIANLFNTCPDPVKIIKWKEILEHLEDALDHCEKIADLVRGVVMKYA